MTADRKARQPGKLATWTNGPRRCGAIPFTSLWINRDRVMPSCRTETETVSGMEKAGPISCVAAISQWHHRLSACVKAHSGHFEHICDGFTA